MDGAFDSPEEAALSGWSHTPGAQARVVEVQQPSATEALVIIEVAGHPGYNRDLVTVSRDTNGRWRWTGSTGASAP